MVLRVRWRTGVAIGVAAAALVLSAPVTGNSQTPPRRFATLQEAIVAGVLDADVVNQLHSGGSTDPIVSLAPAIQAAALEKAAASPVPVRTDEPDPASAAPTRAGAVDEVTVPNADIAAAELDVSRRDVLRAAGSGATELRRYGPIPATHFSVRSDAALLRLVNSPDVGHVTFNERNKAFLSSTLPFIGQPTAAAAGLTGAGTYVGVLDTGADYTVSDLGLCTSPGVPAGCRVLAEQDFAPDDGLLDDNGHGTNVSSIVARTAPGTTLFVGDVFDTDGAFTSDIILGEQWLIAKKQAGYNVVAVNLSLGGSARFTGNCTDTFQFATLLANGIQPVVAAGNSGYLSGNPNFFDGISSPACISGAVSVGAVYDGNYGSVGWGSPLACTDSTTTANKITCFSQSAPNLTLLAPGVSVLAGGITESGTSQATPHVAASVALARACRPDLSAAQVISALQNTGVSIADTRVAGRVTKRIALAGLASGFPAFANDNRAGATALALVGATSYNTCSATAEGGEPAHSGVAATHSVWYRLSPSSVSYIAATFPGTARIALYKTGFNNPEPVIACAGGGSCNRYRLDPGSYDLAIDSSTVSSGTLTLAPAYGPGGDARSAPLVIAEGGAALPSSTTTATVELGETTPSGSTPNATLWYRLTTASLGRATISLSTANGTKRLAIYDAGTTTIRAQSIAGANVGAGPFAMNGAYDIQVSGDEGPFTLAWTIDHASTSPPSNDTAGSALDLSPATGGTDSTRSNVFATTDAGGTKSIWYHWTAPATGIAAFSTRGTNFDTTLRMYSDAGSTLIDTSGDINPTEVGWSTVARSVTAGDQYWFAVSTNDGTEGAVQMDWLLNTRSAAPDAAPPATTPRGPAPIAVPPATTPRGPAPVAILQP